MSKKKKVKPPVIETKPIIKAPLPKPKYQKEDLALVAKASTVLREKEMTVKSLVELQKSLEDLKTAYAGLVKEFNDKERAIKFLNNEVEAQGRALDNAKESIKKEKAKEYAYIEKKTKEIREASAIYESLLQTVKEKEKRLSSLISNEKERVAGIVQDNERMQRHVDEVKKEASNKWADVLKREEQLSIDKLEFDAYKDSLKSELEQIEKDKLENEQLIKTNKEIKSKAEAIMATFQHDRSKKDAEIAQERAKVKEYELALSNKEAKLKQWEKEISEHELRVQEADANISILVRKHNLENKLK